MRSPFGVTARYIDFLFNREETVVDDNEYIEALNRYTAMDGTAQLVASIRVMPDDTELQLPPSDESKVGDDV